MCICCIVLLPRRATKIQYSTQAISHHCILKDNGYPKKSNGNSIIQINITGLTVGFQYTVSDMIYSTLQYEGQRTPCAQRQIYQLGIRNNNTNITPTHSASIQDFLCLRCSTKYNKYNLKDSRHLFFDKQSVYIEKKTAGKLPTYQM